MRPPRGDGRLRDRRPGVVQPDLGDRGDGRDEDQPALRPAGRVGGELEQAPEELELVPERAQRDEVVHRPGGVDDVRHLLLHGGVDHGHQTQPLGGGIDLESGDLGPLFLGEVQPSRLEGSAVERSSAGGRRRVSALLLADEADDAPDLRSPGEVGDAVGAETPRAARQENDGVVGAAGLLLLPRAGPAEAVLIDELLHLLDSVSGRVSLAAAAARPSQNRRRHLPHRRVAVYELGRYHLGHVHVLQTLRLGRRGNENSPQLEGLQGVDAQVEEAVVDGPRRDGRLEPQVLVHKSLDVLLEVVEVQRPDALGGGLHQPLVDGLDLLVEQGVRLLAGDGPLVGPRDDLAAGHDDDGVRRGDTRRGVHLLPGGRDDGPDRLAERLLVHRREQRLPRLDDDAEVELVLAERDGGLDRGRLAQHRLEDQGVGLLPRRQHDDVVVAADSREVGLGILLVPDELVGDLDALAVAKGEHGEPEPPLAVPGLELGHRELHVVPEPEVLPVVRVRGRKDQGQVARLGGPVEVEELDAARRQPVADAGAQRGAPGAHEVHVRQRLDALVVGEVADGVEEERHRHHGPGLGLLHELDDGHGVRDPVAHGVQRRLARRQGEARGDEAEAVEEGQGREVEALRLLLRVEAVAVEGEEQLAVREGDGLRESRRAGGVEEQDDAVSVLGALEGGHGGGIRVWLVEGVVAVSDVSRDALGCESRQCWLRRLAEALRHDEGAGRGCLHQRIDGSRRKTRRENEGLPRTC
ncbi:hypothetical protein ColKHC_12027 [Colletotrichum higginsianum]|nr:hypothetical protein ColKHC_12027 [Colletotrichum higginsianum]